MTERLRVLLLAGVGPTSNIVYHFLADRCEVVALEEPRPARIELVKGRVRKLGYAKVVHQIAFQMGIAPIISLLGRARRREIVAAHHLDESEIPEGQRIRVPSVNDPAVPGLVRDVRPHLVVVNGTRIIGKKLLAEISVPIVNIHAGITPRYRGVHGGFWALAEGRPDLFGVTLHRVDAGVDTGGVVGQAVITPTSRDSYATYPLLQLAHGLQILDENLVQLAAGEPLSVEPIDHESRLRYHPTVVEYVVGVARARMWSRSRVKDEG